MERPALPKQAGMAERIWYRLGCVGGKGGRMPTGKDANAERGVGNVAKPELLVVGKKENQWELKVRFCYLPKLTGNPVI